ncbi:hypothetical protein [uncultured Algimonas sp.]|uniref:hypothetical protein n=1 Tax=uncultured Algimonas sp. TaxID=1547920 RepID=UPI00261BB1E8|nr:hypothetical protein [uncultured Algimonas sp.]
MNETTAFAQSPSETQADKRWYVCVSDAVYGPFSDPTLWGYVQEGRVIAASDLSLRPDGGFLPAKDWLEIAHWFHTPIPSPVVETTAQALPVTYANLALVMAEIRSGRTADFLRDLRRAGEETRLGETVWLLRTNASPDQAHALLGPSLGVGDSLFVMDATHAKFSAYNLGEDANAGLEAICEAQIGAR